LPVTILRNDFKSATADGRYLVDNAKKCGPGSRPGDYFPGVADILSKLPKTVYKITSQGTNGAPGAVYHVTAIRNLVGYKDLYSAQADFFTCNGDEGHLKAVQLNNDWIAFGETCSLADTECQRMATIIESSIRIK